MYAGTAQDAKNWGCNGRKHLRWSCSSLFQKNGSKCALCASPCFATPVWCEEKRVTVLGISVTIDAELVWYNEFSMCGYSGELRCLNFPPKSIMLGRASKIETILKCSGSVGNFNWWVSKFFVNLYRWKVQQYCITYKIQNHSFFVGFFH